MQFNTLYRDGCQPITALLGVFIGRSQFGTIDTVLGAPWNNGDFPLPTDDEAT